MCMGVVRMKWVMRRQVILLNFERGDEWEDRVQVVGELQERN
jgi:hypothetical protein